MQLNIKLNEGMTLKHAAMELEQMNSALSSILVNGPILCNPNSEVPEGFLGNVNTPPNEFGYVSIVIENYRKLILPQGVAPSTFSIVLGDAVEETNGGDIWVGNII